MTLISGSPLNTIPRGVWARFALKCQGRPSKEKLIEAGPKGKPRIRCAIQQGTLSGRRWTSSDVPLFSDTEARENGTKQVLARHLAGDFPERPLSEAQILGEQFEAS